MNKNKISHVGVKFAVCIVCILIISSAKSLFVSVYLAKSKIMFIRLLHLSS